jgi:hypothetical protein
VPSSCSGTGGLASTGGATGVGGGTSARGSVSATYDELVLRDKLVVFWAMNKLSGSELDLTGNNHAGT